ncbi:MAG TPA: DNA repair protein RecO, partial [Lysinibacillus sp.]|nr:DNA repair protein RecO [Lysinibacillus sp.]
ETKYFIKKIITTIYEEQTGIRFKTRKFIEQLERTPELQIRTVNEEKPEEP